MDILAECFYNSAVLCWSIYLLSLRVALFACMCITKNYIWQSQFNWLLSFNLNETCSDYFRVTCVRFREDGCLYEGATALTYVQFLLSPIRNKSANTRWVSRLQNWSDRRMAQTWGDKRSISIWCELSFEANLTSALKTSSFCVWLIHKRRCLMYVNNELS